PSASARRGTRRTRETRRAGGRGPGTRWARSPPCPGPPGSAPARRRAARRARAPGTERSAAPGGTMNESGCPWCLSWRSALGELSLGDLLGQLGVRAIAELLLDRADHPARHLGILAGQLGDRLDHGVAQLDLAQALRQVLVAPADLEVDLVELLL